MTRVALVGLGEVGRVFAEDLGSAGHELTVWDTAFSDAGSAASRNAAELGLTPAGSGPAAAADAELVVSAVTPAQCVPAASSVQAGLATRAWFLDLNSSSPGHKVEAAHLVDMQGARYVEAALMAAIHPRRLSSPLLLGGPHARGFSEVSAGLGFADVTVIADEVGRAAATKLCRSVVVKGLESLLTESLLTARRFGVEREVLDSLPNILPPADWEAVARYFMARSLQHGRRRAEEMTEAVATVAEARVDPLMSTATVGRQRWAAQFPQALDADTTIGMVDILLEAMEEGAGR